MPLEDELLLSPSESPSGDSACSCWSNWTGCGASPCSSGWAANSAALSLSLLLLLALLLDPVPGALCLPGVVDLPRPLPLIGEEIFLLLQFYTGGFCWYFFFLAQGFLVQSPWLLTILLYLQLQSTLLGSCCPCPRVPCSVTVVTGNPALSAAPVHTSWFMLPVKCLHSVSQARVLIPSPVALRSFFL